MFDKEELEILEAMENDTLVQSVNLEEEISMTTFGKKMNAMNTIKKLREESADTTLTVQTAESLIEYCNIIVPLTVQKQIAATSNDPDTVFALCDKALEHFKVEYSAKLFGDIQLTESLKEDL